jgi:hypothetical protein
MRRLLTAVLISNALVLGAGPAEAHHQPGPCAVDWWGPWKRHHDVEPVRDLIRCAAHRWTVPGGATRAIAIFTCESRLRPNAIGGDNLGVAQHKDDYWPSRAWTYLRHRWFPHKAFPSAYGTDDDRRLAFNARANVIVGIRYAHVDGWGPWSCA